MCEKIHLDKFLILSCMLICLRLFSLDGAANIMALLTISFNLEWLFNLRVLEIRKKYCCSNEKYRIR